MIVRFSKGPSRVVRRDSGMVVNDHCAEDFASIETVLYVLFVDTEIDTEIANDGLKSSRRKCVEPRVLGCVGHFHCQ